MYIDRFNSFIFCHYIILISLIQFTANPFRCYTCLNCTKSNQKVLSGCGACVTTRGSGIISKFCGTTCERLYIDDQISCCSTDLCNGMTKLSIHRHVIIVLFVCIGISKYIL
uniref:Putative sm29; Sm29 n=1 Tax=Schistosoma mansoni TaxID=6183 RepID=A0A5K4EGB2_SCHMA